MLGIEHCKSLLRVRGFDEYEPVGKIEKEYLQLISEALSFYKECLQYKFVLNLVYVKSPLSLRNIGVKYKHADFHMPYITWAYWRGGYRVTVVDWNIVSAELDKANATLDERLLHMRVHMAMVDFKVRSKNIAERLRSAHKLKIELENMLAQENFEYRDMPEFMRYAQI